MSNEKIKVKLWRVGEIVMMQVLEMPERLRNKGAIWSGEVAGGCVTVSSVYKPCVDLRRAEEGDIAEKGALQVEEVLLWGAFEEDDERVIGVDARSPSSAHLVMEQIRLAIVQANKALNEPEPKQRLMAYRMKTMVVSDRVESEHGEGALCHIE